ncbi:hypothetical protein BH11MYX3_BH11MYX3_39610 [soil metagenome]
MKSILFLSVILFGACVDVVDDSVAEDSTDVPRLSSNGMSPSSLQATYLDGAALTGASVSPYLGTSGSQLFINYMVGCALDSTQSITSGSLTFYGIHGLAPSWSSGALTLSQRRLVSACLLARTNWSGSNMTISMRGTSPALSLVGTEGTTYSKQEGAYYGDLFGGQFTRHVCMGADVIANPLATQFKTRKCAIDNDQGSSTSMCDFRIAGDCTSHCTVSGDAYSSCTDLNGTSWAEVIKVNLQ